MAASSSGSSVLIKMMLDLEASGVLVENVLAFLLQRLIITF